MPEATLTVSEAVGQKLQELAARTGQSPAAVLEKAVDEYHRRAFWSAVNAGYAALRADPASWAEVEAERAAWDAAALDGLDPGEHWGDDGRPLGSATPASP